jgi:hypothetical protein
MTSVAQAVSLSIYMYIPLQQDLGLKYVSQTIQRQVIHLVLQGAFWVNI